MFVDAFEKGASLRLEDLSRRDIDTFIRGNSIKTKGFLHKTVRDSILKPGIWKDITAKARDVFDPNWHGVELRWPNFLTRVCQPSQVQFPGTKSSYVIGLMDMSIRAGCFLVSSLIRGLKWSGMCFNMGQPGNTDLQVLDWR